MRILIVAATDAEIDPLRPALGERVHVLTTGVGMVATAVHCARELAVGGYDAALNLGVCGSFNPRYPPGTAVHVTSDRIAELGAQDGDAFLTIHDLGLLGVDDFPYKAGRLINATPPSWPALASLPSVSGITVNTVHGNSDAIERVVDRFHPDVETMEGAAFMYACLLRGVPFAQVRAVSNMVERRNRPAWKMREALDVLTQTATAILRQA